MTQPTKRQNSFSSLATLKVGNSSYSYYSLPTAAKQLHLNLSQLPFSIRILLENLLRQEDGKLVKKEDVETLAGWRPTGLPEKEIPFIPSRVLLQDFTGVPVVVDMAAMRDAAKQLGTDPAKINPLFPVDLVIDHSVQVDAFGSADAFQKNIEMEYLRNRERYAFLRWGQKALKNFRAVPPGAGIVHQVNLEFLASVVVRKGDEVSPDTVIGTDSHTTMINGLGVLGWGVGGIEAEAAMLGQPMYMLMPEVVGVNLTGRIPAGATATDAVLTVTQMLRKKNVVGKFVEFFGPGLSLLSIPDRATIANMAPEYGATVGFFPVDQETINYLRLTGRNESAELTEAYCRQQGLFRTDASAKPNFSETLELDLSTIEPSLAGPKRPQDRVPLRDVKSSFLKSLTAPIKERGFELPSDKVNQKVSVLLSEKRHEVSQGAVVIAAITSCTNTSNPSVMMSAGLLAKKAVEKGLTVKPTVKTSLAPGSQVVTDYLDTAGLTPYLDKLGFQLVGYGCTTCIGNSGPLPEAVAAGIKEGDLVAAAVLSGNRNFEGRINPHVRANYLASPPLVVAYALAGRMDLDLLTEPLGIGKNGKPVFLKDIWPSEEEIQETLRKIGWLEVFRKRYSDILVGNDNWKSLAIPEGDLYRFDDASTYIKRPPYFEGVTLTVPAVKDIRGARVLALLGDSVTTDHISPAGSIAKDGPAAKYLMSLGVQPKDFNSYGARRGNHEVMVRGTFANIRLKNLLVPGSEGGITIHLPSEKVMPIYDAAMEYKKDGTPLMVIAGKEYGSGSSRDWAAKGPALLGVRVVIAESYERIHRSNLVGMGVLPLQFKTGTNRESLGLMGREVFDLAGLKDLTPKGLLPVNIRREDGTTFSFECIIRADTPVEVDYLRQGGILPAVLRQICRK